MVHHPRGNSQITSRHNDTACRVPVGVGDVWREDWAVRVSQTIRCELRIRRWEVGIADQIGQHSVLDRKVVYEAYCRPRQSGKCPIQVKLFPSNRFGAEGRKKKVNQAYPLICFWYKTDPDVLITLNWAPEFYRLQLLLLALNETSTQFEFSVHKCMHA